ncbi:trichohyalin-like [Paramacrobiotus metropolitanus]|uniref:trichohyalin-like n=1 Tax=Paramacrobiotus metropolitanus TaxID=2943436 RepID=UPI002445E51B|nr:trichohyalin-like [Paramacrobiotus metropolitanus]
MEGNGDNMPMATARNSDDICIDRDTGSPMRVRRSGVAYEILLDGEARGSPGKSLGSPVARRVGDVAEQPAAPPLTAEQLNEKLVAAEARREAAINELRNRCLEHNVGRVQQAIQKRSLAEKQQADELKESIDKELEQARANVEARRLAQLEKLKQQENHHREIQNRQNMEFEERLRQMDTKYSEINGNRDRILQEIVEKLKEHNERVQEVHEKMVAAQSSMPDGSTETVSEEQRQWINAANERDEYIRGAKERMRQANFDLDTENVVVAQDQRHQ